MLCYFHPTKEKEVRMKATPIELTMDDIGMIDYEDEVDKVAKFVPLENLI